MELQPSLTVSQFEVYRCHNTIGESDSMMQTTDRHKLMSIIRTLAPPTYITVSRADKIDPPASQQAGRQTDVVPARPASTNTIISVEEHPSVADCCWVRRSDGWIRREVDAQWRGMLIAETPCSSPGHRLAPAAASENTDGQSCRILGPEDHPTRLCLSVDAKNSPTTHWRSIDRSPASRRVENDSRCLDV